MIQNVQFSTTTKISQSYQRNKKVGLSFGVSLPSHLGGVLYFGEKKKNKKVWSIPEEINNIVPEEA